MQISVFSKTAIAERRTRTLSRLKSLNIDLGLILISCGNPIVKPGGLDQTYEFLPLPEYYWLTGLRRPDGILAYHQDHGWVDFIQPVTKAEQIWEGAKPFDMSGSQPLAVFESWYKKQDLSKVTLIGDFSVFSDLNNLDRSTERHLLIQNALDEERRIKDEEEIELITSCSKIAAKAYSLFDNLIKTGITERQIQIEYEAQIFREGSHKSPYDTIVGTGTRSAVLHAIPGNTKVQKNDLILIDAGADLYDYCVDITRVYFEGGTKTTQQNSIYEIVAQAQNQAIKMCLPGTEWHDVHRAAATVIGQGLIDLGLIKGSLVDLLEDGVVSLFFPHGIGHMVGQRVRDVGGRKWGRSPRKSCGNMVRVDFPLEAGFVMTVEPGLYFIEAILNDPEVRIKFKDHVIWSQVDKWINFGGIRLEDDVLIDTNGPKNLTGQIPK